jgi:hypothetical protein
MRTNMTENYVSTTRATCHVDVPVHLPVRLILSRFYGKMRLADTRTPKRDMTCGATSGQLILRHVKNGF